MTKFPSISAISALGLNRQIGLNGHLPWDLPEEYQHYLSTVKGHHVVIGRKNLEANGSDVKGCHPLIMSRSMNSNKFPTFKTPSDLLKYVTAQNIKKVFVIGGADIYELFLPMVSEFHFTEVNYNGPADTYFPKFDQYKWITQKEEHHPVTINNSLAWTYRLMTKQGEFHE
jgi:dihydrofolate reductase